MNTAKLIEIYQENRLLKQITVRGIKVAFQSLTRFLGKDPKIEEIHLDQVVAWRHHMAKTVSPITYNSYLTQLLSVFRFASAQGYCNSQHPILSLRKTRVDRRTPPTVNEEFFDAAQRFLSTPAIGVERGLFEPRWFWWIVILTLSYTAIRRRQLVELRWKDINWQEHHITLRKESSKNGRAWVIPIPEPIIEALILLRNKTANACGKIDPDWQVFHLPFFTHRQRKCRSRGLTADYLSMRMSRLSKIIGVHCSPHKLRHTAATRWLNLTGQLKTVKNILGHSSDKATLGYVHPDINQIRGALATFR